MAPVVVLVRDIRTALISHHVKWRQEYDVNFSRYVRGDPSGRRYHADAWWYIRFFNRWGRLAARYPDKIMILRYEDLGRDAGSCLRQVCEHLQLQIDEPAIAAALCVSTRQAVRDRLDPRATEVIIPSRSALATTKFAADDDAFLRAVCSRYLRFDFGYGYVTSSSTQSA